MMLNRILKPALVLLLVLAAVPAVAAPVTVTWDPNPETDIVSYVVHWGTRPGIYTNTGTVSGDVTTWQSPDLLGGRTYYFVLQAVNADGLSSPFSDEASVSLPGEWRPVAGDFAGTGAADFTVFRRDRGLWLIRGGSPIAFGAAADVPVVGDYDGDGLSDIALWRPSTGVWSVLHSSDGYQPGSVLQVQWGSQAKGDVPVPGDYDGDGRTDIAVWRRGSGMWYILPSGDEYSAASALAIQWGIARQNDVPVQADYDGDGATDIAVWRAKTGQWCILRSSDGFSASSPQVLQWGIGRQKDVPVPGDYDGDGLADIGVWRRTSGTWYILQSSDGYDRSAPLAVQWGARSDTPVPADFDGDGKTDLAVWRPSSGTWYVVQSSLGLDRSKFISVQWGVGSLHDVPATGTVPLAATNPALAGY